MASTRTFGVATACPPPSPLGQCSPALAVLTRIRSPCTSLVPSPLGLQHLLASPLCSPLSADPLVPAVGPLTHVWALVYWLVVYLVGWNPLAVKVPAAVRIA
jgi:hypothetical protein